MLKKNMFRKWLGVKIRSIGRSNKEIFDDVYANRRWGTNPDCMPSSGKGSFVENASEYENFIVDFVNNNNISSILDVGCGDFQVSSRILSRLEREVDYLGVDVSQIIIDQNRSAHESDKIKFRQLDAVKDEIPAADLIMIREVLQHLSNGQVNKVLKKLVPMAESNNILITNTVSRNPERLNMDIPPGSASRAGMKSGLWLDKPPFNMRVEEKLRVQHKNHDTEIITCRLLGN